MVPCAVNIVENTHVVAKHKHSRGLSPCYGHLINVTVRAIARQGFKVLLEPHVVV